MADWMHDDITWCADEHCESINCLRNQANMRDKFGIHSFSDFRGTDMCPLTKLIKKDGNHIESD